MMMMDWGGDGGGPKQNIHEQRGKKMRKTGKTIMVGASKRCEPGIRVRESSPIFGTAGRLGLYVGKIYTR